jgi:hypothetical protein
VEAYGVNLGDKLKDLLALLQSKAYRCKPVRTVPLRGIIYALVLYGQAIGQHWIPAFAH